MRARSHIARVVSDRLHHNLIEKFSFYGRMPLRGVDTVNARIEEQNASHDQSNEDEAHNHGAFFLFPLVVVLRQ